MPAWMKGKLFRYGFMVFFLAMFGNMLFGTYQVFREAASLREVVTLFWTLDVPWRFAYHGSAEPWVAQFAFGFYSLMLTSVILGILTMLFTSRAPGVSTAPWAP